MPNRADPGQERKPGPPATQGLGVTSTQGARAGGCLHPWLALAQLSAPLPAPPPCTAQKKKKNERTTQATR